MPLPSAERLDLVPGPADDDTRARGIPTVPPATSRASRWKPSTRSCAELLGHDRLEVGLGDLDLAVGQLLEPGEGLVESVSLDPDAHLLQGVGEGVASRVLAQHDLAAYLAHARRRR